MANNFKKGTTGHAIVDQVVIDHKYANLAAFDCLHTLPQYFGNVEIGIDNVTLVAAKDRSKITLIQELKMSFASRMGEPCEGVVIRRNVEGGAEEVKCHSAIIWMIKCCVAGSANPSKTFSFIVSSFAEKLVECCDRPMYIDMGQTSPFGKYLETELNKWLFEVCEEYNIPCIQEVSTKKVRPAMAKLLEAAGSGSLVEE